MSQSLTHWTERSVDDYAHRITFDFVTQIGKALDGISQDELASKLGVSKGRVSQILNSPGNLSLKNVIKYARAIGRKVSLVLYDDEDQTNMKGPINSEVFAMCWEKCGRPIDFFDMETASTSGFIQHDVLYGPSWTYSTIVGFPSLYTRGDYQTSLTRESRMHVMIPEQTAKTQ